MKIALISCVKSKRNEECTAKDLYISPLFKMNYAYAKKTCDKIFILSAKYGLLSETDIIEPYEKTLNKMKIAERKEWAEKVLYELQTKADLQKDKFVILAGTKYRVDLLPHIKNYEIPFDKFSFGKQLQRLKELIK